MYGYLNQQLPSWIDAHVRLFNFIGGVPRMICPDNLKTGVTKHLHDEIVLNRMYQEMADHYDTVVLPAWVRKPRDKASVEMSVNVLANWIIGRLRNQTYFELQELQKALSLALQEHNNKPFQKKEGSRNSVFNVEEKPELLPLPLHDYEPSLWSTALVASHYHITIDKMHYSVLLITTFVIPSIFEPHYVLLRYFIMTYVSRLIQDCKERWVNI